MNEGTKNKTTLLGVALFLSGAALLGVQVRASGHVEGMTAYIGAGAAFLGALCIDPDAIGAGFRMVAAVLPWAKGHDDGPKP